MNATVTAHETSDVRGDEAPEPLDLSKDEVFHLLQNERRRNVLRYLEGVDEPVRMRDVAEQVAAWEHDTTVRALTSDQRQRVYIPLYQNHLPKLADNEIIEYNQSRGIVEPTEATDHLNQYLETTENDEEGSAGQTETRADDARSWPQYYLAVSTIGAFLLALTSLGVLSIPGGGAVLVGIVILAMYSALTVVHMVVEN